MKKKVFLLAACLIFGGSIGKAAAQDSAKEQEYDYQEMNLQPLSPTFLDNVFVSNFWDSNWFLSAKVGISAFVGTPIGHGDIFDRNKEMSNISFGKWFTPQVAARLSYQGIEFVDADIQTRSFQNYHFDVMYNIASYFRNNTESVRKWDITPYVGLGLIRNSYTRQKPFAFSYGIAGKYRIADRIHVAAELGVTTTWQDFDGPQGASDKLGDHLLQASIGLDIAIGKVGWKRVIDPKPYIYQNDLLINRLEKMKDENTQLKKMHMKDTMALTEMRKILEIEGLLEKYHIAMQGESTNKTYPKNNYSGLNSLRARLLNRKWNGDTENYKPIVNENYKLQGKDSTTIATNYYKEVLKNEKNYIGAPIFFFFKLATDELTECEQIINIKEVAKVAREYSLNIQVTGAADNMTGTPEINEKLSAKRAKYIARLLRDYGVPQDKIHTQYSGGINDYEPLEANRNTCVMLYNNMSHEGSQY